MVIKLATFALITVVALLQDVEIRPKLVAGDKFRLELGRVRRDSSQPQAAVASRTLIDVQVVSVDPKGFVLDWAPGETTFGNSQMAQDPIVAAIARAERGMRFRLALSADGEFTGVLNEAEIQPKLQAMVSGITKEFSGRLPADQRTSFESTMGQVLSPANMISSATRDAQIYWGLYGAAVAAGETVSANLQQPNPTGGMPIPATLNVRMDSANATSAVLTTTMVYDKNALMKMTTDLAERAGARVRPDDISKLPAIQMADDGKYEFDRTLGLMRKVTVTRRVSMMGVERLDGWTITLVESPKR